MTGISVVEWESRNQRVIAERRITGRTREVPTVRVPLRLVPGEPVEYRDLPAIAIAPGVAATLGWGRGALLERVEMQPAAVYPPQTLREELIILVQDGSASVDVGDRTIELSKDEVLYLEPGTTRSMTAGAHGWRAFEVYSPVRLDHLAHAGQDTDGIDVTFPDQGVTASLPPGVAVTLDEIPWTPVVDPVEGGRSTAWSRLIWGRNAQISLIRMDPGSTIAWHFHPEDQLTHTVRGTLDQGVMDRSFPASGAAGHMLFLPGGMAHAAALGETGADQFDVFWPVRPDYMARARAAGVLRLDGRPTTKPTQLAE